MSWTHQQHAANALLWLVGAYFLFPNATILGQSSYIGAPILALVYSYGAEMLANYLPALPM
jgi:hypothetical protein